jgi:ornithine cyclodeaminase/alanine dehydrogenase-like protein (mu-crystallin family)
MMAFSVRQQLFRKASIIVVDSKAQAQKYGDVAKSFQPGIIKPEALQELGDFLTKGLTGNPKRIIADFSGIGPQDVALVEYALTQIG